MRGWQAPGRVRRGLVAVLVCSLAAACSSQAHASRGNQSIGGKHAGGSSGSSNASGGNGGANGSSAPAPAASAMGPLLPFATATVTAHDPSTDAKTSGDAPTYAEILSGSVQGLGGNVRLSVTVQGSLPSQMPDSTQYMIVSWNIGGDKTHKSVGFSAQATEKGWSISAGGNDGTVKYPGTYSVSGDTISLTFPWSFVGGPRKFEWSASASWFGNGNGTSSYAEDNIPQAFFPKNHPAK